MHYKSFSREWFEHELREVLKEAGFKFTDSMKEVSVELTGPWVTNEFVYLVAGARGPGRAPRWDAPQLLIYSSVDKTTGRSRERGEDAVRIVARRGTERGFVYSRVRKLLRVEGLLRKSRNLKAALNEYWGDLRHPEHLPWRTAPIEVEQPAHTEHREAHEYPREQPTSDEADVALPSNSRPEGERQTSQPVPACRADDPGRGMPAPEPFPGLPARSRFSRFLGVVAGSRYATAGLLVAVTVALVALYVSMR
jgi:hypothetical protein